MISALGHLHDLPAVGRIFVYGAGAAGQAMVRVLERADRPVCACIDSQRSAPTATPPVLAFDAYLALRRGEDTILICSSFAADIRANLRRHGVPAFDASELSINLVGEEKRLLSILKDGRFIMSDA